VSASISYTSQFKHNDWIDFVDSVQAGGTNGINGRMHAIEAEFTTLSGVIAQINAALVILPPTVSLTFAPAFLPNGTNVPWVQSSGVASKGGTQTAADGWMQLALPDGVLLQSVTIIGSKSGNVGSFQIKLCRQPFPGTAVLPLLSIPVSDQQDTFQFTAPLLSPPQVDNSANKYLLTATIVGADAAATAQLTAIQIGYKRS
jgi:hypothetical protein